MKRSGIPAELFLYKTSFCSEKDQSEFRTGREIKTYFKIMRIHYRSYQHTIEKEISSTLSESQNLC